MNIRTILLSAGALVLAASVDLRAQGVELSPFFGYRFGGDFEDSLTGETYSIQSSTTYGLMLDLPFGNAGVRTELLWSRQDTNIDLRGAYGLGTIDLTVDNFELGGIGEEPKGKFVEYISAHVGVTHISADGYGSETRLNFSVGVGAKFFLRPNVALKTEIRGTCTFVDGDATIIAIDGISVVQFSGSTLWQGQATVGLSVLF